MLYAWERSLKCVVHASWNAYDPRKLDRIFLSHQSVCNAILETGDGGNDYQLPHVYKNGLETTTGNLPVSLPVSAAAMTAFHML
jgi:hypothetical protein